MNKHSKGDTWRIRQSGLGGGFRVRSARPQYRVVQLPRLSPEAAYRYKVVLYANRRSVEEASLAFGNPISTIYRWRARFNPRDLSSLEPKSRRPKRTRRQQWTAAQEQAVLDLRRAFPGCGKQPLAVRLARQGAILSPSTVGRILASLKRRQLLVEPRSHRTKRPRPARPYAIRMPKDRRRPPPIPGALVQLDTMHLRPRPGLERRQFTAIDVASRVAVLSVRSCAIAGTARDHLAELIERMPFPIRAIQVDGGSEFMGEFELACRDAGIPLYVLPPHSPKLNGFVERLNRTVREEFWDRHHGPFDLATLQPALRAWEIAYNTDRPHSALGYATPMDYLHSHDFSDVSD